MELTCITLWQPWASWIALGWKSIETRNHPQFAHLVGKRIGIHAGLRWDTQAIGMAAEWLTLEQQHQSDLLRGVKGVLVATAFVRHHERCMMYDSGKALIECGSRRYGLFLDDVNPLVAPIPMRGYQGVWSIALPEYTMCRKCGCMEEKACVKNLTPCHWVSPDLCSACVDPSTN